MTGHEVFWGGAPLCETYRAVVEDVSETPPAPKLSIVSVPGGEDIDLTDALTGGAAFENRRLSLTLFCPGRDDAAGLENAVSGRESDFELSWDPGYTYHGRASVTGRKEWPGQGVRLSVEITASPWRLREVHAVTVDAAGGVWVECESGRRPVRPVITCDYPVTVNWDGREFVVPSGQSYRMSLVEFGQGKNRIWLNAYRERAATWADLASRTWGDVSSTPWARVTVGDDGGGGFAGSAMVTLRWREEWL